MTQISQMGGEGFLALAGLVRHLTLRAQTPLLVLERFLGAGDSINI